MTVDSEIDASADGRDWWPTEDTSELRPIFAAVLEHSLNQPDTIAVVFGERHWTYGQLAADIDAFARSLLAAGVAPGDRVATMSTPRPEFLITYLAASSIGAVWQGLNPKYTSSELAYIMGDARPKVIFALGDDREERKRVDKAASAADLDSTQVILGDVADGDGNYVSESDFLAQASDVSATALKSTRDSVPVDSVAILVYTSGTTGTPKGAMVRHSGLSRLAYVQSRRWGIAQPRIIVNQPINHIGCVGDLCSVTLYAAGTLVFSDRFDPGRTLELISTQNVNALFQVPVQLQMIAADKSFSTTDLTSLEIVGWGGGTMPEKVIDAYRTRGVRVQNTYGLTEVASSVSYSRSGASNSELNTTVGQPDPQLQLRFLAESGGWGPVEGPGEICVKHPTVMLGYLNDEKKTAETFTSDGWLRTGDIGELDSDGNLHLIGRAHEMFKSGGYNVYPREIESVLESMPEIVAAAVVPRTDEKYGEVGVAFVETSADISAEALAVATRSQLANYKIPKEFHFTRLPVLPNLKVDKQTLRRRAAAAHETASASR